jgi:heme-degrading monooxygenase HmoA
MPQTIEIVRFKLKPETAREDFITRNKDVEQNVIMKMPGIITRETAMTEDKDVVVVLHWERPEDAQNSMDKFVANPATHAFTSLIDMSTFTMTRFTRV